MGREILAYFRPLPFARSRRWPPLRLLARLSEGICAASLARVHPLSLFAAQLSGLMMETI